MTKAEQARISRTAFYRWKRRFDAHGKAGLGDRPRTPQRSPRATPREVVGKILYLRQQYHFGPGRIADYLRRFHQVAIARSSVHRILGKHGMNRLPANQKHQPRHKRWKRYEKPQPGHRLQMDVKFLERIRRSWLAQDKLYQHRRGRARRFGRERFKGTCELRHTSPLAMNRVRKVRTH
jgi:hypothetical protein